MAILPWFARRRQIDRDLQDEIQSHLAMAAADRIADGADLRVARQAAIRDFGNIALTTEAARSVWSNWWLDAVGHLSNDVRYAVRVLAKSPGFSLTVCAVLALGIALNAAVFMLLKSLALNPVSGVDGSAGLAVVLHETNAGRQAGISYPDYQYLRDHDQAFTGITGSAFVSISLGRGSDAQRVMGEFVTGNYFQMLGVRAHLGRPLVPSDEVAPGQHPWVVLSDGLWRRAFGADPAILGKTIHVNSYPLTVVGVADPSFHGTVVSFDIELFMPLMMAEQIGLNFGSFQQAPLNVLSDRRTDILMVLGRLRPGQTIATAAAQTAVLSTQLARDAKLDEPTQALKVLPIWRSPYGAQTYMLPGVMVLGVMGILLLLIVCANLAGLVLARGVSRRGEIAVRLALGASRVRIVRLLLVENLALAVPGALLGLALVSGLPFLWGSTATAGAPGRMFLNIGIDRLVVAFSALVACLCAWLFGFMPALQISRVDLASVMKEDLSPRAGVRGRLRAVLVIAQVAVSLLLLVGAALVARSLDATRHADAGFDSNGVVSVSVDVSPSGYDKTRGFTFYQQLLDAVRADQGVESATIASIYPLTLVDIGARRVDVEGYDTDSGDDLTFLTNTIAPDYFRTLKIGLVAGREFETRDDAAALQVSIVNETLARRFWGGPSNALGKRVKVSSGEWRTVVGVVRDVKYARINETPRPYVYLPFLQSYQSGMILQTRGTASLPTLIEQARAHIHALDPNLPILDAKPLTEQTRASLTIFEMVAAVLFAFGLAGMALAAMGIYGLVAYTVRQSTHEIGIRMALGARHAAVVSRFLGRGLRLGLIGALIGVGAALVLTRLLRAVLFGVSATDPTSFAVAAAIVIASTLLATLVPAWRAARVSPMSALRQH